MTILYLFICIISWYSYAHDSTLVWFTGKRKCSNPYVPGTEVPNWNALQGKVKFITLAYNLHCDILLYSIWNLSPPKNNELQKHNASGKIALKCNFRKDSLKMPLNEKAWWKDETNISLIFYWFIFKPSVKFSCLGEREKKKGWLNEISLDDSLKFNSYIVIWVF